MNPTPTYQAIVQTSSHMAHAAHQGDWAEVTRLEAVAAQQVAALKAQPTPHAMTAQQRRARLDALKAILRFDAEIRHLAEPHWALVQQWLHPTQHAAVGSAGPIQVGR